MSQEFDRLKETLIASPAARARFLTSVFDMLEKNGVDTSNPDLAKELDVSLDLRDGKRFVADTLSSTAVVTLVM